MMQVRKVLMIVPYKARDLEAAALVAWHLREKFGIETVCTNGYQIPRKLRAIAPDALVLDHLEWDFKAREARFARDLGMKVFLLPTEGLFQDTAAALRSVGRHHEATGLVDACFAWGEYLRRPVLAEGLLSAPRIPATGCPRFDFYREPWLQLMGSREGFARRCEFADPAAPLLLWCTNTPYFARDARRIVRRYVSRAPWTEEQVQAFIDDETVQFREHGRCVMDLARRHPEWNFIIKVHPAEWIDPYLPMARELPNVKLAHAEPIRDFLFHCDVLLQRNCTTATEAWMLGKPVLDLEIGSYQRVARSEYKEGSTIVRNRAEAEEAILGFLRGAPVPEAQQAAREAFLAEFYHRIDGCAAERCADHIAASLLPGAHDASRKTEAVQQERVRFEARESRRWPNRIKDLLGIPRERSLRWWRRVLPSEGRWFGGRRDNEMEIRPEMVRELQLRYDRVAPARKA